MGRPSDGVNRRLVCLSQVILGVRQRFHDGVRLPRVTRSLSARKGYCFTTDAPNGCFVRWIW